MDLRALTRTLALVTGTSERFRRIDGGKTSPSYALAALAPLDGAEGSTRLEAAVSRLAARCRAHERTVDVLSRAVLALRRANVALREENASLRVELAQAQRAHDELRHDSAQSG